MAIKHPLFQTILIGNMSDVDKILYIHFVSLCNRDFCSCKITAYLQNGGNKYELFVVNENTPRLSPM